MELRASTCSVTFMVPISAAMADPTRPASISPVMTGPSSRNMPTATTAPPMVSILTVWSWNRVWASSTAPVNAPVMMTTGWDCTPIFAICSTRTRIRNLPDHMHAATW